MLRATLSLGLALVCVSTAQAGMPIEQELRCAVGGEAFTHVTTASYTIFGSRPDGKPYGSWSIPLDLPACPSNGLVMFREFDDAEVKRLTTLIAEPEYRRLIDRDTPYYRAAWLARRLDPQSSDTVWLLMQAGWETDDRPQLRARYLRELVAATEAMPRVDETAWLSAQARAVNARRELGEFEAAAAAIAALPLAEEAAAQPSSAGEPTENQAGALDAAEQRRQIAGFLKALTVVIARRDTSSEPLDMIDPSEAAARCRELGDQAAATPGGAVCQEPKVAEIMALIEDD